MLSKISMKSNKKNHYSQFLLKKFRYFTLACTTISYQTLALLTNANFSPVSAQVAPSLCAVPGKDGVGVISTSTINTYYAGLANSTVNAGATSIPLGAMNLEGSTTPITEGDLLLVIQMQGADINSSNTSNYGSGLGNSTGNVSTNFTAGTYEYVVATSSVSGNSVSIRGAGLNSGLRYSYTNTTTGASDQRRTYQVIRVPQYSSATLNTTLTAARWNGSSGGVLVYDVAGNLNLNSATMDVNSKGFRGGGGLRLRFVDTSKPAPLNTDYRTSAPSGINSEYGANGSKGEGTTGTPRYTLNPDFILSGNIFTPNSFTLSDNGSEGYPDGSFGRGAPGNAGGGSTDGDPDGTLRPGQGLVNAENSGGGGGGNGGSGGKGGRPWRSGNAPLSLDTGGFGGDIFSVASSNRVVMGGGGGAGTNNDATSQSPFFPNNTDGRASSGAPGGGIVLLRTGSVSGTGDINANGATAFNVGQDGGGGGGAGGSVVATALSNNMQGLNITAKGGDGGKVIIPNDPHGPGGGGGGGVIFSTSASILPDAVNGGSPGTATDPVSLTDPYYGAAFGDTGKASTISPTNSNLGIRSGAECVPQLIVRKSTSTARIQTKPGKAIYTITVSNAADRATANQVRITDPLPSGFIYDGTAPVITISDPITNAPQNVNPNIIPSVGATNLDFGTFDIRGGSTLSITFTVDVGVNVPDGIYQNGATATYLDPQRTTNNGTTSSRYDEASSNAEDVAVGSVPIPPTPPQIFRIRGVKRITNVIRNGVSLTGVNFNTVIDDPNDTNDDASIWASSQLVPTGVTRMNPQLKLGVGDEVEYTVYFLVDGNQPITSARFCDPIPQGTTFISNSGSDITLNLANTITNQTNIADGDRASYVSPVAPGPANNVCPLQSNPTGAVLVNFGTLDFTPGNNFGFTRFRVRVE
ncbi:hypothetical protein NIES4071_23910 [Calothrix sp. NIES-4071]|nr:hypothetical protein NIES4071_23910 [Calothrix sp. NIES-4071]BAZ56715.1 hypothetical protein NIES4105_23860 [Calothrix sp. NIES-4105]